ncbi:hypothetical protein AWY79_07605 [Pseudodesulfovibrio indicus]|uniref:Uncharacterized protein n=1 Tax=Pseudodesulfovibrio indicus TaxID=1716143 RepID=A0ABN4LZZ2_9BACT|nr:hypothetical protein AWY79_07605 [Pseudodesulfovibrio indicus]
MTGAPAGGFVVPPEASGAAGAGPGLAAGAGLGIGLAAGAGAVLAAGIVAVLAASTGLVSICVGLDAVLAAGFALSGFPGPGLGPSFVGAAFPFFVAGAGLAADCDAGFFSGGIDFTWMRIDSQRSNPLSGADRPILTVLDTQSFP